MLFTSTAAIVALASSLTRVQAYWLVAGHITGFGGPVGQEGNSWRMADDLECNTLINATPVVNEKSDVSGDKDGVRIEWTGGDCGGSWWGTQCPTVVEQHFPGLHQTWYADRNGEMFDLGGNVVGHCTVNLETDKQCDVTAGVVRYQTLLECTQNA